MAGVAPAWGGRRWWCAGRGLLWDWTHSGTRAGRRSGLRRPETLLLELLADLDDGPGDGRVAHAAGQCGELGLADLLIQEKVLAHDREDLLERSLGEADFALRRVLLVAAVFGGPPVGVRGRRLPGWLVSHEQVQVFNLHGRVGSGPR